MDKTVLYDQHEGNLQMREGYGPVANAKERYRHNYIVVSEVDPSREQKRNVVQIYISCVSP